MKAFTSRIAARRAPPPSSPRPYKVGWCNDVRCAFNWASQKSSSGPERRCACSVANERGAGARAVCGPGGRTVLKRIVTFHPCRPWVPGRCRSSVRHVMDGSGTPAAALLMKHSLAMPSGPIRNAFERSHQRTEFIPTRTILDTLCSIGDLYSTTPLPNRVGLVVVRSCLGGSRRNLASRGAIATYDQRPEFLRVRSNPPT